jgi:hypothetical protein
MKRSGKGQNNEKNIDLPLFGTEKSVSVLQCSIKQNNEHPVVSNVVSFKEAVDSMRITAQSAVEKDALESILSRARKINW